MPTTARTEESIFAEALQKGSPEERVAYLDKACVNDAALRARVEKLLNSHEQAGSFLREPLAATVDQPPVAEPPSIAEKPGTVIGLWARLRRRAIAPGPPKSGAQGHQARHG
jgi:eukaryotic-like serine/threonine-protein kinase